jgi:DNA-binding IclR family transcriptional regulator
MGHATGARTLNTLEKCVRILTLFTESAPVLGVAEIAARLDLPRSTAYRYISALRAHRFVEEAPDGAGYRLGGRILELAATMARKPLREVALPHMERIARETGETALLCGLREHVGVCLEKVDGTHALRVSYELGETYPLHAGSTGKAILAHLDPEERDAVIDDVGLPKFTETTITSVGKLKKELAKIRACGYAESEGESIVGTHGIAAPIFSPSGRIMGSIGVSVPHLRAEEKNRDRLIRLVVEAAKKISEGLNAQEARER